MKAMEVILYENYPQLGYVGDRVFVRSGFARNYLFPRGIAVPLNVKNERFLKHQLTQIEGKKVRLRSEAEEVSSNISSEKLSFSLKVGAGGKSFGSISSRDIHSQLLEKGHELDRRQIKLSEPIRKPGSYTVEVKLHTEVSAEVSVEVEGIEVKQSKKETTGKSERKKEKEEESQADEELRAEDASSGEEENNEESSEKKEEDAGDATE